MSLPFPQNMRLSLPYHSDYSLHTTEEDYCFMGEEEMRVFTSARKIFTSVDHEIVGELNENDIFSILNISNEAVEVERTVLKMVNYDEFVRDTETVKVYQGEIYNFTKNDQFTVGMQHDGWVNLRLISTKLSKEEI